MRNLLSERALRRLDALNIYEPLATQRGFHESTARISILRGSNRGGKTLPAAAEVARALLGIDPYKKYKVGDQRWYAVGKDLKHIGEVMWRKLGQPGAFRIIRDLTSGVWRSYRPWDPLDRDRENQARPAPPLIPERFIEDIAWESKREGIPVKVVMKNGSELNFYSSLGKPPQGSDLDGAWFDEEIVDPNWYPEMVARLLDRKGRLIWSATPQAGTEILYALHERAQTERIRVKPSITEHLILLAENPHIDLEQKRGLAQDLDEESRKVRIEGEFAFVGFRVYAEFTMLVHGIDLPQGVPPHWTRFMIVDPGHRVCAVLFAAVPPRPELDAVVLYDELYLKECNASIFAKAVSDQTRGQTIQLCIIDPNMSAYTEMGAGKSVGRQYTEALQAYEFTTLQTGAQFILGSDDRAAGRLAVRGMLRVRDDGTPRLRVLLGRCPNLEHEFKHYVRKRISGQVIDEPNERSNNHLMDCVRYLAMYNPQYIPPSEKKPPQSPAFKSFRAKQLAKKAKQGGGGINLGPGRSFYA